jgi:hypothetical protein
MNIDYALLAKAVEIYKIKGYEFIEVPWIVSVASSRSTNPPEDGIFKLQHDDVSLVGSAEQGFIEIIKQLEPNKKYAAISPCFRKGDNRDHLHQETFMKLELFSYNSDSNNVYFSFLDDARSVFLQLGKKWICPSHLITTESLFDENIDICYRNVEIGSYGYRDLVIDDIPYRINYGTGLALPRYSQLDQHIIWM